MRYVGREKKNTSKSWNATTCHEIVSRSLVVLTFRNMPLLCIKKYLKCYKKLVYKKIKSSQISNCTPHSSPFFPLLFLLSLHYLPTTTQRSVIYHTQPLELDFHAHYHCSIFPYTQCPPGLFY